MYDDYDPNDDDLQRRGIWYLKPGHKNINKLTELELERLLGTAKDQDRKQMIMQALQSLENQSPLASSLNGRPFAQIPALHPTASNQLFGGQKIPLEVITKSGGPRSRPASAQRRRPSISSNLDMIPENRKLPQHPQEKYGSEVNISLDDIREVCTSSVDFRFFPKNIFMTPIMPARICWVATGLLPQFLTVTMHDKWQLRNVEVRCHGVDSMSLMLDNMGGGGLPPSCPVAKQGDGVFIFDGSEIQTEYGRGIHATSSFTLVFEKASEIFFSVSSIKVQAVRMC